MKEYTIKSNRFTKETSVTGTLLELKHYYRVHLANSSELKSIDLLIKELNLKNNVYREVK